MNIPDFAKYITKQNDGKIRVPIGQVNEILKDTNHALGGYLYALISAITKNEVKKNMDIPYKKISKIHKKLNL